MGSVLTRLVRSMEDDAEDPSQQEFDSAWQSLRGLLVREMKRRGLWTSPPTFLGIVGHPHWVDQGVVSDALDELTAQCFEFVFVRRRASLSQQARTKPDIDGIVRLAIRHFLHETQRRNDPLGFRLFEVLRRTVERGEDEGLLHLHRAGRRVDNRTWIASRPDLVPDIEPSTTTSFDPDPLASSWTAHYLDELITSSHSALKQLLGTLAAELSDSLDEAGSSGLLRFGSLATSLKTSGRTAWADRSLEVRSIHTEDSESGVEVPSEEFEYLRRFRSIVTCVDRALGTVDERPRTLLYLRRLWRFLRNLSLESTRHPALGDLEPGELPSHRQLSELLDIPRDRVSGLLDTLGKLLRGCRHSMDSLPEGTAMSDPTQANPSERARASLARLGSARDTPTPDLRQPPAVGQILHLQGVDVDGVFWLVLETDRTQERVLVAPVDQAPFLGADDVCLGGEHDEDPGSPWILRGDRQAWVRHDVLSQAAPEVVHSLDEQALASNLRDLRDDGRFRMDPEMPTYRDWMEDGPDKAMERLAKLPIPFPKPESTAKPERSRFLWQAVAAVLAVALGSVVYQLQTARHVIEQLAQPIVDLPYREIRLSPDGRGEFQLELPPSADHVQLGLLLPSLPEADRVRIELFQGDSESSLYRSEPLLPSREYTLTLPRTLAADGILTLRIVAADDDASENRASDEEVLYEESVFWDREGAPFS